MLGLTPARSSQAETKAEASRAKRISVLPFAVFPISSHQGEVAVLPGTLEPLKIVSPKTIGDV